jgi:UPF0755 protein
MRTQIRKALRRLTALGTIAAAMACAAGAYYLMAAITPPRIPVQFDLRKGSTLTTVAHQLTDAGVLRQPALFVLLGRILGKARSVKAGNYEIEAPLTPLQLLRKITVGDYTQVAIVFPEGWTFRQMRGLLDEHPALLHETSGLSDADILGRLGSDAASTEGWFFPDTYYVSSGSSDLAVLRRAHRLMREHLARQWDQKVEGLPLTDPYEALILASIVEKETGRPEERPLIAAVFINRLRIGMKLQTDPTVIYGLRENFDGNLRKRDLVADTPYNTYTRTGLPPTPIAMPGLGSLSAALNPAPVDALYFVARGDGTSQFSQTLAEHERAVTKYQRSGQR